MTSKLTIAEPRLLENVTMHADKAPTLNRLLDILANSGIHVDAKSGRILAHRGTGGTIGADDIDRELARFPVRLQDGRKGVLYVDRRPDYVRDKTLALLTRPA